MKKTIIVSVCAAIGIWLLWQILKPNMNQNANEMVKIIKRISNEVKYNDTLPQEYQLLFSAETNRWLSLENVVKYGSRNVVVHYRYKDSFYLAIYKIGEIDFKKIHNDLLIEGSKSDAGGDTWYYVDNIENFDLKFKREHSLPTDSVFLNFSENPKTIESNDSVTAYFLNHSLFTIRNDRNSQPDIFAYKRHDAFFETTVKSMALVKKRPSVFLIVIESDDNVKLPETLILDILKE